MFKKHITRFISIIFIVIVAVGFISGIGTSTDKIKYSMTDYYKARNVSDLVLRSTSLTGFSESQLSGIDSLKETYGANNVSTGVQLDIQTEIDGEDHTVQRHPAPGAGSLPRRRPMRNTARVHLRRL